MVLPAAIFPFGRVSLRLLWLWSLIGCLLLTGKARGEDTSSHPAYLFSTQWSAAAYSEKASGSVCWIDGSDGSLRVEVLRNDRPWTETGPDLVPLLERSGYGWTLVLGPEQTGTVNDWGSEWRQVPEGLAQLVRLVTASLNSYPEPPPRFGFAAQVGAHRRAPGIPRPRVLATIWPDLERTDAWRYQLAPLSLETDQRPVGPNFRRNMTARGRGTGGDGEILILRWALATGGDGYGLSLSSSRRPGTLHLAPAGKLAVAPVEPEVFLPLWPLSQFFQAR